MSSLYFDSSYINIKKASTDQVWREMILNPVLISCCLWLCCFLKSTRMQWVTELGDAHHVPDPQDDGSRADMATQAAARGVPAVPRRGRHHHLLCVCRHLQTVSVYVKEESPLSYRRLHRARVDEQALTAPDPSGTYHGEQLSGPERDKPASQLKSRLPFFQN